MKKVKVFGLGWLGDRATIKRTPLLNMLVMCGGESPVVVSVCDCMDHMVDGNKKGAEYIMKLFQEKVEERDKSHMHTDCFFDFAANIQKAGAILCANYP